MRKSVWPSSIEQAECLRSNMPDLPVPLGRYEASPWYIAGPYFVRSRMKVCCMLRCHVSNYQPEIMKQLVQQKQDNNTASSRQARPKQKHQHGRPVPIVSSTRTVPFVVTAAISLPFSATFATSLHMTREKYSTSPLLGSQDLFNLYFGCSNPR